MNVTFTGSCNRALLLAGLAGILATPSAQAQGISTRPVRMVIAQTTGTTPDLLARTLAPRLSAKWNQPFVVENRPGAAGAIGMEQLAKSAPDGHTITINVSSTLTIPLFFPAQNFNVLTSFAPITMVGSNIFALAIHPSIPAANVREFVAWAKNEGPKLNYGSPGNGTYHHLIMEQFKLQTGLTATHVPYKGSAQAFTDLLGGQIGAMFVPMGVALNYVKDNKVRLLGGSAKDRSPLTPDVPSLHELGISNFDVSAWFAVWGPAGMTPDLVAKYNAVFRELLAEPEVRVALAKQGVAVRTSTPEELARINKDEYESLAKLVREAKIKGD
jgi:tripartite-type tricarboxylate transporter receptor subunit TctC